MHSGYHIHEINILLILHVNMLLLYQEKQTNINTSKEK